MTSADAQLKLRPPAWARAWAAVFPSLFAGFLLFVVRPDDAGSTTGGVVALVGGTLIAWRLFRLAAVGSTDGRLAIRNHWRDREVHRDDVTDVVIGVAGSAPNRSVQLVLRDGSTVRLDGGAWNGLPRRCARGSIARLSRSSDLTRHALGRSTDVYGRG